jgi:hypothetical protein
MQKITEAEVLAILEELYLEGRVSKSMVDGEEAYQLIDKSPSSNLKMDSKPTQGVSFNLLQGHNPPIPYRLMGWRNEGYEVTGVKGVRQISRFFPMSEKEEAKKYLLELDNGNLWHSEASDYTDPDYGVFTGRRKRVHILTPDALYK